MKFKVTSTLRKELVKIKRKDSHLAHKIQKQLKLFQEYHRHPSLRTHKLKGSLRNTWSISITGDIRMHYYVKGDVAYFFDIGSHDELYK